MVLPYRILKKLLNNLGPHLNAMSIQRINGLIDIKEKLFHHARRTHGVIIRTGTHHKRNDDKDFETLLKDLTKLKAHQRIPGREFGGIKYSENLIESERFDRAAFYRWVTTKNKESASAFKGSNVEAAIPSSTPTA